jgi:hypothetical protein
LNIQPIVPQVADRRLLCWIKRPRFGRLMLYPGHPSLAIAGFVVVGIVEDSALGAYLDFQTVVGHLAV